jgi:hypothetical protein
MQELIGLIAILAGRHHAMVLSKSRARSVPAQ